MTDCCTPDDYRKPFTTRSARRNASAYRKDGFSGVSAHLLEALTDLDVDGESILEVGGGVGALQLALLGAGATKAVNVELSPSYEEEAIALASTAGFGDRIQRHVLDFAEGAETVNPADIVIMHRVVCCYPDAQKLMTAAASRARRYLAVTFPRPSPLNSLTFRLENLWWWARRAAFRVFVHPPETIYAAARDEGLTPVVDVEDGIWQLVVFARA